MAVQAYPYLIITDGVDTVTIQDGLGGTPNWPLQADSWAPAVPAVRANQLGGRGPYADVEEEMTIDILGTTAALCYANLETLTRLLDKADRWWRRGENASLVLMKYVPQGSTIHAHTGTMLQAIVLGRAGGDDLNAAELPKSTSEAGMLFELYGIKIACIRRGAWTGASDNSGASASAANPSVMTVAFGATHPINSPMTISIGGFQQATTPTISAGFLAVGSTSTDIQIVEAEGAASGTFTSVNDAANNARGGNVLRFTPGVTTPVNSGTITSLAGTSGVLAVIAAVRNNSATTTFSVTANFTDKSTNPATTPAYLVDTSTTSPRLVLLGTVNALFLSNMSFTVQASAASGTFDIDYVILVNLRDETCAVVAHDAVALTNLGAGAVSLDFLFNPTADRGPTVLAVRSSFSAPVVYRGPLPFITKGINVYATWAGTNGTSWRFTSTAPAVVSTTLTATRYRSYISPQ